MQHQFPILKPVMMSSDFLKKLFIFVGILFLIVMIGPYLGLHPLGTPSIPQSALDRLRGAQAPRIQGSLPDDDEMVQIPREQALEDLGELDVIEDNEDNGE